MRPLFHTLLLTALLGPCGCVRFHPQPLTAETNLAQFEARSLDSPELKRFFEEHVAAPTWPLANWDFEQLTLAAFFYNPDLDVARAKWGTAQGARGIAGERPNPSVTFAPGYNTTAPPPWILGLSFDVPIETAGKRGYRIAQAKQLSDAARLNIASVAWTVRGRVRKSLSQLLAAGERLRLLTEQKSFQDRNLRLLEQQLEAGAASRFEVAQVRLSQQTAQLARRDAEKQFVLARTELADAIGLTAAAIDPAKISFAGLTNAPPEFSFEEIRRSALINRSDIRGALAEYGASESALQLEIAKQYPDIHLSPGYQLDQTDNKWSLGATLTLPILNQNQGAIAEARARRAESAAHFNAIQTKAIAEVDRARQGYDIALEKLRLADSLLADQERQLQSSAQMLAAGTISNQELVASEVELNTVRLMRFGVWVEAQDALAALEEAVQRPLAPATPLPSPETGRSLPGAGDK